MHCTWRVPLPISKKEKYHQAPSYSAHLIRRYWKTLDKSFSLDKYHKDPSKEENDILFEVWPYSNRHALMPNQSANAFGPGGALLLS